MRGSPPRTITLTIAWRGRPIPTILTIHNLAYQGLFDRRRLSHLGIPDAAFQIDGVEFYGKLSFLKAGIYYSSHITTVSSTYAQEITQPESGCGLDGLLRTRAEQGRLDGIINGIDESWDPSRDPYLVSPFSAENCHGKRSNARNVRLSRKAMTGGGNLRIELRFLMLSALSQSGI